MKFKKEILKELTWSDEVEGLAVVENKLVDSTRWSLVYSLVFSFDGLFYQTSYSTGATESQYEEPFDYADDEIECVEVFPVKKLITVYEPQTNGEKNEAA